MEQQPFESQLAFVRNLGPMGKASVAAFRRPPSRAVRDFRAVLFFISDRAVTSGHGFSRAETSA